MGDDGIRSTIRGGFRFALLLTLASAGCHAGAEGIYTWIDGNNVTNFSQLPRADGAQVEQPGDTAPVVIVPSGEVEAGGLAARRASARLITPEMRRLGIRLADTPMAQESREARDELRVARGAMSIPIAGPRAAWR